jgi:hypothetical protein
MTEPRNSADSSAWWRGLRSERGSVLPLAVCALAVTAGFLVAALCLLQLRVDRLKIRSVADVAVLTAVTHGCAQAGTVMTRNAATMTRCVRNPDTSETVLEAVVRRRIGLLGTVTMTVPARGGYAE